VVVCGVVVGGLSVVVVVAAGTVCIEAVEGAAVGGGAEVLAAGAGVGGGASVWAGGWGGGMLTVDGVVCAGVVRGTVATESGEVTAGACRRDAGVVGGSDACDPLGLNDAGRAAFPGSSWPTSATAIPAAANAPTVTHAVASETFRMEPSRTQREPGFADANTTAARSSAASTDPMAAALSHSAIQRARV
jgi:hypothetical protein